MSGWLVPSSGCGSVDVLGTPTSSMDSTPTPWNCWKGDLSLPWDDIQLGHSNHWPGLATHSIRHPPQSGIRNPPSPADMRLVGIQPTAVEGSAQTTAELVEAAVHVNPRTSAASFGEKDPNRTHQAVTVSGRRGPSFAAK